MTDPAPASPDEVAPIVAVGRTVGGLLLVIVGVVLGLAGAFVFFVVPLIAAFSDDDSIWNTLWNLDFLGAVVAGIGIVLLVVGGALMRRARKRDLQILVDPAAVAGQLRDAGAEPSPAKPTVTPPTTIT